MLDQHQALHCRGLLVRKILVAGMLVRSLAGLAGVKVFPTFTYTSNDEGWNRQPLENAD
jgi:hypothetical protein